MQIVLCLNKRKIRGKKSLPPRSIESEYPESENLTKRQRVYNEVTPELGLNLRLEVVKYPMQVRDHVQEVAETLEEVLQAAEKGLTKLPPRK